MNARKKIGKEDAIIASKLAMRRRVLCKLQDCKNELHDRNDKQFRRKFEKEKLMKKYPLWEK